MYYYITCKSAEFGKNQIVKYRKSFDALTGEEFKIQIFADARYKLYVNGNFVAVGPTKGNDKELFYDEIDLSKYIQNGKNLIEIYVLSLAPVGNAIGHRYVTSLRRSGMNILQINGKLGDNSFITDDTWECAVCKGVEFIVPEYAYYTGLPEKVTEKFYEAEEYEKAYPVSDMTKLIFYGEPNIWYSKKTPIPMQKLTEIKINPKINSVFDFGYLTTSYLSIKFKGKGMVKLTYAERYFNTENDNRTDANGEICGDYDTVYVNGEMIFRPFWFRSFRFLQAESSGDVEILEATAYETGYPIEKNEYDFGNEIDNKLWEISFRTLERCMQDTFCDCPYYEQLQYAMDTYMQHIFAYQVSGDDRLQRKSIKDFAMSANAEGLTQARTPSGQTQYIPSFALYYILMVLKHYDIYECKDLLLENIPYMINVIRWYEKHLNEDYLVTKSEYWHFIDWSDDFSNSYPGKGVPKCNNTIGIESLMLSYVLQKFSKVLACTEYESMAKKYLDLAEKINKSAEVQYYSKENNLYADSDDKAHFSQHMQIWAVLSGIADEKRAKEIMIKSFELEKNQATFAYSYLLFRALEKADVYDLRTDMLNRLRNMVKYNCSTIPETPTDARSECHAWGAVVLYEFCAKDLGVRQIKDKIVINPYIKDRDYAKGTVYTKYGAIYVSWKKENDKLYIYYKAPNDVNVELQSNDNMELVLCDKDF